MKFSFTKFR